MVKNKKLEEKIIEEKQQKIPTKELLNRLQWLRNEAESRTRYLQEQKAPGFISGFDAGRSSAFQHCIDLILHCLQGKKKIRKLKKRNLKTKYDKNKNTKRENT